MKLVMGANSFGNPPPTHVGKFFNHTQVTEVIRICKEYGVVEFDTARIYMNGNSEITLGEGLRTVYGKDKKTTTSLLPIVATKAHPVQGLSASNVEKQLNASLEALKQDCVDIFYLHAPDIKVSLEETLATVDRLYRAKKFKELGLSSYLPFQVAQIYYLCKINGWVKPTVYQGLYSLLSRECEHELFLVLRMFKIRFYAFSPLAGGLLASKRQYEEKPSEGRFSRANYFDMFWKKSIFDEIDKLNQSCEKHKIPIRDVALRWIIHHSLLSAKDGDAVVLGASSLDQVRENLRVASTATPLPTDLVSEIDELWTRLGKKSATLEGYFRAVQPVSSL